MPNVLTSLMSFLFISVFWLFLINLQTRIYGCGSKEKYIETDHRYLNFNGDLDGEQ
jgi:hypothetical protein